MFLLFYSINKMRVIISFPLRWMEIKTKKRKIEQNDNEGKKLLYCIWI